MHDTVSQLSHTLAQANRFISMRLEEQGLHGIAPSHGDIFVQLFSQNELPMSDLAQRISRDPSTVTALVKKLVAEGYVLTSKQAGDKRVTLVSLTDKGRKLKPTFEAISNELERVQCNNLAEEDLQALDHALRIMQNNFETALEGERS